MDFESASINSFNSSCNGKLRSVRKRNSVKFQFLPPSIRAFSQKESSSLISPLSHSTFFFNPNRRPNPADVSLTRRLMLDAKRRSALFFINRIRRIFETQPLNLVNSFSQPLIKIYFDRALNGIMAGARNFRIQTGARWMNSFFKGSPMPYRNSKTSPQSP